VKIVGKTHRTWERACYCTNRVALCWKS